MDHLDFTLFLFFGVEVGRGFKDGCLIFLLVILRIDMELTIPSSH